MNVDKYRNELSLMCKNGLPFLLSGTLVWALISVVFLLPLEIHMKNIISFYCTGIMFPMALAFSKVTRAKWKVDENPLGQLALYLNLAQFMYFPIIFYSFITNPEQMILYFAIITAAHLFPFGWLYNSKSFFIMAPAMSLIIFIVGFVFISTHIWTVPLTVFVLLLVLDIWIFKDYYSKYTQKQKEQEKVFA